MALRRLFRGAPATAAWLILLLVTTVLQHVLPHAQVSHLLRERSTNLANLKDDPVKVLFLSLFWLDGAIWLPYAVAFVLFVAPAERWLGTARWLAVGLAGHVGATLASQYLVAREIVAHHADSSLVHANDVGVSYFLAATIGILTYRFDRWWRLAWALIVIGMPGAALALDPTFTALGHLLAALIGLLLAPVTWGRTAPAWSPGALLRKLVSWSRETSQP